MARTTDTDLVSVLRRPDGLYAYVVRRREKFQEPGAEEVDLSTHDPYVERILPLREFELWPSTPLHSALKAWDALARVRRLDATVLSHVINVLLHSLPDDAGDGAVAPLTFDAPPPAIRPTSAHPRAWKGTKARPPKPGKPLGLDLRPHLANSRDVNALIARLAPFQKEAGRLLRNADILSGELPALLDGKGRPKDVYLACLHQGIGRSVLSLPAPFRRGLLFWRRGKPWKTIGRLQALYWALDLERRPALRRCLERPLSFGNLDWLDLLQEQPRERQTAFAELLLESGVDWQDCPRDLAEILKKAGDLSADTHYRNRTYALLRTVSRGGNVRHLLSGIELARSYHPKEIFEPAGASPTAPAEAIRTLVDALSAPWLAHHLWRASAELEGYAELLTDIPWLKLSTSTAKQFLDLLGDVIYTEDPEARGARWASLREAVPRLFACVKEIPAGYQGKALRHLRELIWCREDPEDLAASLQEFLALLPRICRPPFFREGFEQKVFMPLSRLPEIRGAKDEVLRKLERACRRDNDANLIAGGLRSLGGHAPDVVVNGLVNETAALLKAAKILGGLGSTVRRDALRKWTSHPLLRDDLPVEDLIAVLPEEISDVVPRKLKRGMSTLSPGQKDWGWKRILRALPNLRWRLLSHLCLEELKARIGAPGRTANELHALRLYGNIDYNRRALRKFLQAHFAGNKGYLLAHPLNRNWLVKQRLKRAVWLEGMSMKGKLEDGTPLKLHIELDPLEALRLGTYVGSCTGHGGRFAYSAAAIVLDLNKHVVYARNAAGTVVGRQLIGVSKEQELVVFEVYPAGASADLKRLFRDFDVEFARRLGLDIHKPSSDALGYVEPLLSRDWWDDGAWDGDGDFA
jgi:hypothetical protein